MQQAFAGLNGLTREEQFARLVLPRGDWADLPMVERGLAKLLPEFSKFGFEVPQVDELLSICRAERMSEYVTIDSDGAQGGGLETTFSQHGGLRALGKRTDVEAKRLELAVMVVVYVDRWRQRLHSEVLDPDLDKDFTERLMLVWRAIRLLSTAALEYLPDLRQSPKRIYHELDAIKARIDPRKLPEHKRHLNYFSQIRLFLESFLELGAYTQRSGKTSNREIVVKVIVNRETPDPDSDVASVAAKNRLIDHRRTDTDLHKSEHYLQGNAPEELLDGPQFFQSVEPVNVRQGGSLVQSTRLQIGRNVHRRRAAQLLPGRWEVLNAAEIRKFGVALATNDKTIEYASAVALYLVLLTGRELEEVLEFRVVKNREQLPVNRSSSLAYIVAESAEWVVGVVRPVERRTIQGPRKDFLQHHHDDLYLPFPSHFWHFLAPWILQRAQSAKKGTAGLFNQKHKKDIPEQTKTILSGLNRGRAARLTLFRIAYQLTEELHREAGDLIEAILVTGRQPPSGPSAAIYYHSVNRQQLVDYYIAVTDRWQRLIYSDAPSGARQTEFWLDGVVGSELVINTDAIKGCFSGLRLQCQYDHQRLGSRGGLRDLHNSLTNYTIMMLFWLTGYRAVQDPVASSTDLNLRRRILVVTDKTADGNGHSRLVPLCRQLAEQLGIYMAHSERVRQRIAVINHRHHDTLFFYLDEDLNELQVRPKTMEEHLWAYAMPLNLNRHWLRGALRDRGVSGGYVNAFMGHWGVGQEPWGKFSCINPQHYREVVGQALEAVANELGLQVVTESY